MSDTNLATDPNTMQATSMPLQINAQYIKDFSFENPRAPASLRPQSSQPRIDVNVDVQASKVSKDEELFEVVLKITATAKVENDPLFLADLTYAGLFTLQPMDENSLHAVLLVECPRLLFPFARAIVADATRDGGFPPLLIQPVDFASMYRQSKDSAIGTPVASA
ncbi:protein-export chaperone SecB [Thalassobaculum sp. OXR-137]|uniref:protein-export chaperone SecB n=1 Tax=Thalassobaculum sp. OXR-137 TaxID=3100173 RepID=UPI002AC958F9|nr:protein-export chaperone SecB [Thalassobaculum sp. OXR-137]WPZ35491.1 protein-export chaperone SecB [Thalassobaculum sp. OXR-137]